MEKNVWKDEKLIDVLTEGGIVIMPTDTVYGVVGQALNKTTVERIYNTKRIRPEKPCISLIGEMSELEKFSIKPTPEQKNVLEKEWPGPTSIVLDCPEEKFLYLSCGTKTLSLRLPSDAKSRELLVKTGPLIATPANIAGRPPAKNITEAKNYFDNLIDLYIDGGEINKKPSKLIRLLKDGSVTILRE
jgi:L-threonylcarbamoyladenylate synthase